MKKMFYLTLLLLVGISGSALAQFSAGTVSLGGGVSYSSSKTKISSGSSSTTSDPVVSYSFSPGLGYFVSENLEIGGILSYSLTREADVFDAGTENETSILALGPFVRGYYSLGESTALFAQGSLLAGFGTTEVLINDSWDGPDKFELNTNTFIVGITPGIVFKPAERLGLELSAGFIGYNSTTFSPEDNDDDSKMTNSTFSFSLDISTVQLGARFYLGN